MLNVGDPIEIVWRDAVTYPLEPDCDEDDYQPGTINRDIGYYVGVVKNFVLIALEQGEGGGNRGRTQIPLGDVIEVIPLKRMKAVWKEGKKYGVSNRRQRGASGIRNRNGKGYARGEGKVRSSKPRRGQTTRKTHGKGV